MIEDINKSFLFALLQEASRDWKSTLWFALPIHLISNLQITFLIVQTTSSDLLNVPWTVLNVLKKYSCVFLVIDQPIFLESHTLVQIFWWSLIIYFLLHITLLFRTYHLHQKGKLGTRKFQNMVSITYILHSRVIFLPIHYFLIKLLALHFNDNTISKNALYHYGIPGMIVTLILCGMNFGIAFLKEMFSYHIKKSKDSLASKNNLYCKIMLLHKTIQIILRNFVDISIQPGLLTASNLVFSLAYLYDLLTKFSFYNIIILKSSIVFSALNLVLSIGLIISLSSKPKKYMEPILLVSIPCCLHISLKYINTRLRKISQLQFLTPDEAVHAPILLKEFLGSNSLSISSKENALKALGYETGLLEFYRNGNEDISKNPRNLNRVQQLYTVVLKKMEAIHKRYPSSEVLAIVSAQIYINKFGNASKGLNILNKLRLTNLSIAAKRSIDCILLKLEEKFGKNYKNSEEKLDAAKYFENRDYINNLKDHIQTEIAQHLKFWRELYSDNVNAKTIVDSSMAIQTSEKTIRKLWNQTFENSDRILGTLVLMYGSYLELVKNSSHERADLLKKYDSLTRSREESGQELSLFNEESAVFLVSVEVEKIGRVIDCSASVKNIFKIARDKLLGQKIDHLMPKVVARVHDQFIQKYNRLGVQNLNRNFITYARTLEGNFFQAHLEIKIYPSISRGLNGIAHLKKLKNEEQILLVNRVGAIVDCSADLLATLNLSIRDMESFRATDICPEFYYIQQAFNIFYSGDKEIYVPTLEEFRKAQSQHKEETLTNPPETHLFAKKLLSQKMVSLRSNEEKYVSLDSQNITVVEDKKLADTEEPQSRLSVNSKSPFISRDRLTLAEAEVRGLELINKEKAEEICEKYKDGVKLTFYPIKKESNPTAKTEVAFQVSVEPMPVGGEYYKIVKLRAYRVEERIINLIKTEAFAALMQKAAVKPSPFRALSIPSPTLFVKSKTKEEEAPNKDQDSDRNTNLENLPSEGDDQDPLNRPKIDERRIKKLLTKKFPKKNDPQKAQLISENAPESRKIRRRNTLHGEESSTHSRSTNHSEIDTIKTLNQVFRNRNLRPLTKVSVFMVYFSMIIVVALAFTNFVYSTKSFTDISRGVTIIDIAYKRLVDALVSWQWIMLVYSRSVGIRGVVASFITSSREIIYERTISMIERNTRLAEELENVNMPKFNDIFFNKNHALWQPYQNQTFDYDLVDSFTATRVLATKNLYIANFTGSVFLLNQSTTLLFTVNNTANDYILHGESEIGLAGKVLEDVIDNNKILLILLFVLQCLALLFVLLCLLLLIRVIHRSYNRLFRVLTKIKDHDVVQRIVELETLRECFDENVETKAFVEKLEAYLEKAKPAIKNLRITKQKRKTRTYQEEKFVLRDMVIYMLKHLTIIIILLASLIAIVYVSFDKYMNGFNELRTLRNRLSLSYQIGYEFDMLLPTFYFYIIFKDQAQFFLRNKKPGVQLDSLLETLANANKNLVASLADSKTGQIANKNVDLFLTTNICNFIQSTAISNCDKASQGGVLSFLEVNSYYYAAHVFYIDKFNQNPTYDTAKTLLIPYAVEIVNDISIIEDSFDYLSSLLLDDFNDTITTKKSLVKLFFILVLVSILGSTVIMQAISLERFKKIDLTIKSIFSIIPFSMIVDNKILGSFLTNEYKNELHSYARFLQHHS